MNQREKTLAISTCAVVVLIVGFFGYRRVQTGFIKKEKELSSLKSKIRKNDDVIFEGAEANAQLQSLLPRSLSSDLLIAQTEYKKWLNGLAQHVKLEEFSINPQGKKPEKGLYTYQTFSLKGKGDLGQLVDLLYGMQEKDYLHRISKIQLTPIARDPYSMVITLETEVMSLVQAPRKQSPPKTLSNRLSKTHEEYSNIILNRNVFSPENSAPELKSKNSTKIAKGEVLKYEVGAKDPENTYVDYAILGDIPKGMKIDESKGVVSWEPREVGEYEILVAARDRGIPRKTSEQLLKISVVEAPPVKVVEEKKFDIATQAVVTAFLAGGKQPEVWINSRIEGKTLFLKIGDELSLGNIKGKVIAIGANYAEIETDGNRWMINESDNNLAESFKRMEKQKDKESDETKASA